MPIAYSPRVTGEPLDVYIVAAGLAGPLRGWTTLSKRIEEHVQEPKKPLLTVVAEGSSLAKASYTIIPFISDVVVAAPWPRAVHPTRVEVRGIVAVR